VARTAGSRNAGYEEARLALARRVRPSLLKADGVRASLRELARAGDVSVATLKHYFGDRPGVLRAVMETIRIDGAPYMAQASLPVPGDLRASLETFLRRIISVWERHRVGAMHAAMLAEGLSSPALGPEYVTLMLEPFLQTGEALLRGHVEQGELQRCDVRHAALTLLGPVLLGLLHQDSLGGARCRPLALVELVPAHVAAFLSAFPPRGRRGPRAA
jgi:AcrR family transcriptional regulator